MNRVISLGMGVQSTALYYMSSMGQLPRVDAAIFADPGGERTATHDYIREVLMPWKEANNGLPIVTVNDRNLEQDLLTIGDRKRFASIPAFTKDENGKMGMLRRECTNEYKVEQVHKGIRQFYNIAPRKRTATTEVWIGITTDELDRLFKPDVNWKLHVYPFIGYTITKSGNPYQSYAQRMSRQDVLAWYDKQGIPPPPKSGCYFCPFQRDHSWTRLSIEDKAQWQKALEIDQAIRHATRTGIKNPIYLHSSGKPLEEVPLNQLDLLDELACNGYCHT